MWSCHASLSSIMMPRYLYDDTWGTLLPFRMMELGGEQEILKSKIISFVFDMFNSRKLASQRLINIASFLEDCLAFSTFVI